MGSTLRSYAAEMPGTSATSVAHVSAFSHMDSHAAGIVVDEEVRRLAAKEGLTQAQMVQQYRRLQQSVFDMNSGLKEAYSRPAPRDPAPRVTSTTPTGYGSGPSDAVLLSAFSATVAESKNIPNDYALKMQITASPAWQKFLARNRAGMDFDENMNGRRMSTVRRHQVGHFPTTPAVRSWLAVRGYVGFFDDLADSVEDDPETVKQIYDFVRQVFDKTIPILERRGIRGR